MKTADIYTKYQIPENLQLHMYRVAAVGLVVADFIGDSVKLDKDIVTTTLLLHDVGNIIKFNLEHNSLLADEEIARLKQIKEEFILKYGNEEHEATLKIVNELNVPAKVIDILENTGSSKIHLTIDSDDWYRKVCSYADFRVAPYGVVSVEERFADVIKRYEGRDHVLADIEKTIQKKNNCLILESQIQKKSKSPLSTIDNEKIEALIEELKAYNI